MYGLRGVMDVMVVGRGGGGRGEGARGSMGWCVQMEPKSEA